MTDSVDQPSIESQTEKDIKIWGKVLGDPAPGRRLLGTPVLGGLIKERPEDFLVDEIPLYEPSGEGEHVYLRMQKIDLAHSELLEIVKKHFKVPEGAIGAAGMKDRIAVTSQALTVRMPGKEMPRQPIKDDRVKILWTSRHGNKLRRGHLQGNRFVIRIRGLDPLQAPQVWRGLKELERRGVPNYFGTQRFGYRRNTQRLGVMFLLEQYDRLLEEILGAQGSWFPSHQRPQREAFDRGDYAEAMRRWGRRDVVERAVLAKLVRGKGAKEAIRGVSMHTRSFWGSALQSAIFNRLLDARIEAGDFNRMMIGDIAFKHDSRKTFHVDRGTFGAEDQQARVDKFEISPSGPIIGAEGMIATEEVGLMENQIIEETGLSAEIIRKATDELLGARRPYRVAITNNELDSGFDDHGPYIRIAFDLPRGAYATVVLREILGDAAVESARRDQRDKKVYEGGKGSN